MSVSEIRYVLTWECKNSIIIRSAAHFSHRRFRRQNANLNESDHPRNFSSTRNHLAHMARGPWNFPAAFLYARDDPPNGRPGLRQFDDHSADGILHRGRAGA